MHLSLFVGIFRHGTKAVDEKGRERGGKLH